MASKDDNSNEDNRVGANTVEAANDYTEKETSLKREKARVKSNFTRIKNKLLRLIGEMDLGSRREIQDACDRLDSCLESAIDVMSTLSDLYIKNKELGQGRKVVVEMEKLEEEFSVTYEAARRHLELLKEDTSNAAVSAPKVSSTSSLKAILDPVLYTFAALVVVGMTLALIYIKRKKVIKCYRETVKCFSRQTKDVPPHIYMYENSATLAESEQYVQSMNANLQVSENAYEKLQERSMNADHSYGELKSSCAGHMAPRTSTNTNLYDSEETATGDMLYEELQKQRMTDNHFYGDGTESSVDMDTCIEASNSLENAGVYQPLQILTGTTGHIYGELEGSDHCQMEHTTDNSENKSSVKAKTGQKKAYENLEVRP